MNLMNITLSELMTNSLYTKFVGNKVQEKYQSAVMSDKKFYLQTDTKNKIISKLSEKAGSVRYVAGKKGKNEPYFELEKPIFDDSDIIEDQRGHHKKKAEWSEYTAILFNNALPFFEKGKTYTKTELLRQSSIFLKVDRYRDKIVEVLKEKNNRFYFKTLRSKKRLNYDLAVLAADFYRFFNEQITQEANRLVREFKDKADIQKVFVAVSLSTDEKKIFLEVDEKIFNKYKERKQQIREQFSRKKMKAQKRELECEKAIKEMAQTEFDCLFMYDGFQIFDTSKIEYIKCDKEYLQTLVNDLLKNRLLENAKKRENLLTYEEEIRDTNQRLYRESSFEGGKMYNRALDEELSHIETAMYQEKADFKAKKYKEYVQIYSFLIDFVQMR